MQPVNTEKESIDEQLATLTRGQHPSQSVEDNVGPLAAHLEHIHWRQSLRQRQETCLTFLHAVGEL